MKITDVTVRRYSASREPRTDPGGIQIVEVHTDGGVTGRGFVSAGSASSDLVATLIRRNLKAVVVGESPLLTDFMADNPLLEFQSRLFKGPLLREEVTPEGVVLIPPDAPGLGLELDDAVAAAALVPE